MSRFAKKESATSLADTRHPRRVTGSVLKGHTEWGFIVTYADRNVHIDDMRRVVRFVSSKLIKLASVMVKFRS